MQPERESRERAGFRIHLECARGADPVRRETQRKAAHAPVADPQRVEAIIWALKNQLGLERHGGRVPAGLWARIVQRLLALNAAIWFNWQIGAPVKRSLIAYDH